MSPKIRRYLILGHLWAASIMAPAFALHAISGGLYLIDQKGSYETVSVELPTGASLDFKSATIKTDVDVLLASAGIDYQFEYIRDRGSKIQTRPTSRDYFEIAKTPEGLKATQVSPDIIASMMELHKGHGPQSFKSYQKLVAILLLAVILGGVLVGLLARAYRRQTLAALAIGAVIFGILAV